MLVYTFEFWTHEYLHRLWSSYLDFIFQGLVIMQKNTCGVPVLWALTACIKMCPG